MERLAIINKIRARIDELSPPNSPVVSVGLVITNPTDTLIDEMLDESLLFVLNNSSSVFLPQKSGGVVSVGIDDTTGYIEIPDDYVKLVSFRMKDWMMPVVFASKVSSKLFNRFISGGPHKPQCCIMKRDGKNVLCYYSVRDSHEVEHFYYVPEIKVEELDDCLVDLLCWVCTSRVLPIVGVDNVKALEMVNSML